jgi:hypothetical protein
MPATIPTQEDFDSVKLAFDEHLKAVDAKLLEYDGLPEREKHDFADLEVRVKRLEDKLAISDKPDPVQPAPEPTPNFTPPVRPHLEPGEIEDPPYPQDPDNPINPEEYPQPSPKAHKKHK